MASTTLELDKVEWHTSEQILLTSLIAGIGPRSMAYLIDLSLRLGLLLVYMMILRIIRMSDWLQNPWHWTAMLLAFFSYHLFFEYLNNGQTPGKRLLRIRVVKVDGRPLTFLDTLLRQIFRLVDFLPLFYALGLSVMATTRSSMRLGDMAAATLTIWDRYAPNDFESFIRSFREPESERARLTGEDIKRLHRIVHQLEQLDPKRAQPMAETAYDRLRERYGLATPTEKDYVAELRKLISR